MTTYPSFDERLENPTRWQTSLNPHPPLVSADPTATWLVCACFVVCMGWAFGWVGWMTVCS